MKQGVQARGLKLLAADARNSGAGGIATADYVCGIATERGNNTGRLKEFVMSLPDRHHGIDVPVPGYGGRGS